jgi:hypothetical protein
MIGEDSLYKKKSEFSEADEQHARSQVSREIHRPCLDCKKMLRDSGVIHQSPG